MYYIDDTSRAGAGGFTKGDWRAGGFGAAIAAVAGAALALEVAIARRLLPPAGSS